MWLPPVRPVRPLAGRAAFRCAAALVALALMLPGCVGFGTLGTNRFDDATLPFEYAETAEQLRARRGDPDDVERVSGAAERWTYHEGLRWGGVIPIVVIPVPLAVPIGREHVVYTLEGGVVRGATYVRQTWSGQAWGFVGHRFGHATWDVRD